MKPVVCTKSFDDVLQLIASNPLVGGAEMPALSARELQDASSGRLLSMRVRRHPAAMAIEAGGDGHAALVRLYPDLASGDGILLSPCADGVQVLPLTADEMAMFRELDSPRNLFSLLTGKRPDRSSAAEFHRLVKLGVVVEARS